MFCTSCGYNLAGVEGTFCTQCGTQKPDTAVSAASVPRVKKPRVPVTNKGASVCVAVLLAVVLLMTGVVAIARSSVFNMFAHIEAEELARSVSNLEGRDFSFFNGVMGNLVVSVHEGLQWQGYSTREIARIIDDPGYIALKQEALNGTVRTLLTGNMRHIPSERALSRMIENSIDVFESASGQRLSSRDIDETADFLHWRLIGSIADYHPDRWQWRWQHEPTHADIAEAVDEIWDNNGGGLARMGARFLLSTFSYVLLITIVVLLSVALVYMNRRHLYCLPKVIFAPLLVLGAAGFGAYFAGGAVLDAVSDAVVTNAVRGTAVFIETLFSGYFIAAMRVGIVGVVLSVLSLAYVGYEKYGRR